MADIKSSTGERLETFIYNENTCEHLHRYAIAQQLVAGKRILDIASGEGYGSHLLSMIADEVVGVDIDAETIDLATIKYKKDNLKFLVGSTDNIPCGDRFFDAVISFETIEHHDQHDRMIQEIKRVLKDDGFLLISSPDKLFYSDKPGYKNPFHVKELYKNEFESLLNKYFKNTSFLEQKSFFGSVVVTHSGRSPKDAFTSFKGNYDSIIPTSLDAVYLIGIASDSSLPVLSSSILDGATILEKRFEDFREEITRAVVADVTRELRGSRSFRIGNSILKPFRVIKKLFNA